MWINKKRTWKKRKRFWLVENGWMRDTTYTHANTHRGREWVNEKKSYRFSKECEAIKCDWREFELSLKWLRQTEQKNFLTIKTEANLTYQQIITNESGKKHTHTRTHLHPPSNKRTNKHILVILSIGFHIL